MIESQEAPCPLDTADEISRTLIREAIWHGRRCSWVGAVPEDRLGGRPALCFRALGPDLYGGTAGVGLFLAELAAATGEADARRTALGALRQAASRIDDVPAASASGLYAGRPGIALALALAARALSDPELDDAARGAARAPFDQPGIGEFDLMSGRAGAIVALLALRVLLDDDALLDVAVAQGEAVIDGAERDARGAWWGSASLPDAPGLTGLSHGAAGVAVALLELAAATQTQRYRDVAMAAFDYERSLYDPAARNWPDLRRDVRGEDALDARYSSFWCHGAPGGGLARLRALELVGEDAQLRDEARSALQTTDAWVRAGVSAGSVNYSLCHGLAGNAEILLEGAAVLGSEAVALAELVADAGVEAYQSRGARWPSGAQGGATPSLFLGDAGIGRFYLRRARPQLPSLLVVRPPALVG